MSFHHILNSDLCGVVMHRLQHQAVSLLQQGELSSAPVRSFQLRCLGKAVQKVPLLTETSFFFCKLRLMYIKKESLPQCYFVSAVMCTSIAVNVMFKNLQCSWLAGGNKLSRMPTEPLLAIKGGPPVT